MKPEVSPNLDQSMRDFIITAMPWQRYDTTAIQLGSLQAWLAQRGFLVDTRHFTRI